MSRMHIDMENDMLYDVYENAKVTSVRDRPELNIKKGEEFKAEVWIYSGRAVYVKLNDGRIMRDERK